MIKKLLIIDTYGILFRSYYAISYKILSKDGVNLNAVFGLLNSVLQIFDTVEHTHLIFALDAGGKGKRHELFPDYKANRLACPEDLIPQFDILDEMLNAMGIFSERKIGLEADDIINTYAKTAKEHGMGSIITTFDKDLSQLVSDNICVFNPKLKAFLHHEQVLKSFGVNPDKIADFLALTGDAVDNIPGVFGIGPKKAVDLIQKYGNIAQIYENIENISEGKLKNDLVSGKESAFLSLKLAELIFDEKIAKNFDESKLVKFDKKDIRDEFVKFLHKYSFNSTIKKLNLENYKIDDKLELKQGTLF